MYPLVTIKILESIDLENTLRVDKMRFVGASPEVHLHCDSGPVFMGRNFVLSDLILSSGDRGKDANFPCVEVIKDNYSAKSFETAMRCAAERGQSYRSGGSLVMHNCEVEGLVGSGIIDECRW